MPKHKRQSLKRLLDTFASPQNSFSQLNPSYKNGDWIIPFYGYEDSQYILAKNMVALFGVASLGLPVITKGYTLIQKFRSLDKGTQREIAYDLSHQLKIAALGTSIALRNENANVYEIGPCLGLSSLHYSRWIKEKGIDPSKAIYKLTAVEINEDYVKAAKSLLEIVNKEFISKVEYICEDATVYLPRHMKEGDIVFSSMAQPEVCSCILELSHSIKINFVLSYGEILNLKSIEKTGKTFEDQIDPNLYDVYPFEDKEYNIFAPEIQTFPKELRGKKKMKRFGVLVLPKAERD